MFRVVAISLMVLAIWAGAELHSEGLEGAFGGALASFAEVPSDGEGFERASSAFQRAYDKSESRVDQLLEAPAASD